MSVWAYSVHGSVVTTVVNARNGQRQVFEGVLDQIRNPIARYGMKDGQLEFAFFRTSSLNFDIPSEQRVHE
jgi:hypothetical protein